MRNAIRLVLLPLLSGPISTGLDARIRDAGSRLHPPSVAQDRIVLEAATFEACAACHKGPLSLATWEDGPLLARIVALASEPSSHPVPIPDLGDEDLAELAARLAAD